jgi:hypothetical protein
MDGSSTLDFDFWQWGLQKYERAVATFDGELDALLAAASSGTGPDAGAGGSEGVEDVPR